MTWFDLDLWSIGGFFVKHIVLIAIPAAIVLAAFFPAAAFAFLRTTVGKIAVAVALACMATWELRGWVDGAEQIRADLAASRDEAKAARAAAAAARAQALADRMKTQAANAREAQARQDADDRQEQIHEYELELADQDVADHDAAAKHPADGRDRFRLSSADAERLRRIGTEPSRKHPR